MKKKDDANYSKLAEFIRDCALDTVVVPKQVEDKIIPHNIAVEFSKIGSNINQIAKVLNTANLPINDNVDRALFDVRKAMLDMEEHMKEIKIFLLTSK